MPHKDIPNMLGKVLSGTKYGVKQVGVGKALIWASG
jgi:DNA topoisomerase VI subunit B